MTDRATQLASILRALDELERERMEFLTEWRDRKTRLENQKAKLTGEILSGQLELVV